MTALQTTHDFHVRLGSDERAVADELQGMLVDLIDLALVGKQAHSNVEGRGFRSLHLQLDELVDDWRTLGDEVAERASPSARRPTAGPRRSPAQPRSSRYPPAPLALMRSSRRWRADSPA